jgi:hypothetical protein
MGARLLLALVFGLAIAWAPARASGYCRSSTCTGNGTSGADPSRCEPPRFTDCGIPLSWKRTCIGFSTQASGSANVPAQDARGILARAFAAWEAVDCGTGTAGVRVIDMGLSECGEAEYNDHAGNENILVFRDNNWPHRDGVGDKIALTTVTYDVNTGVIYDADIEVNTAQNHITTDPATSEFDLLAVLTHEAGHFLGLAHSDDMSATMWPNYQSGGAALSDDDKKAICAVFPPVSGLSDTCNPIPRHGYSSQCKTEQVAVKCSASPESGSISLAHLAGLLAICAAVGRRTTRRARRTARGA